MCCMYMESERSVREGMVVTKYMFYVLFSACDVYICVNGYKCIHKDSRS